jgi:hypothetical protein
LEPSGSLGVVAVPDADGVKPNGCADELDGGGVAFVGDQVITGHVRVACIQADGNGGTDLEECHQFGDLLEAAAERELGAGGVFDEDGDLTVAVQAIDGAGDGFGCELEAFVARESLP